MAKRKYNNMYDRYRKAPVNMSQAKIRKCISRVSNKCEKEFLSTHSGHRCCKVCTNLINRISNIAPFSLNIRR